jgi:alpha-glucosidase
MARLGLCVLVTVAAAQSPPIVVVNVGPMQVALAVSGSAAFRVGVHVRDSKAESNASDAISTLFLEQGPPVATTLTRVGDSVGLKAAFGSISIVPSTGELTLLDREGGVIIQGPMFVPPMVTNISVQLSASLGSRFYSYGGGAQEPGVGGDPWAAVSSTPAVGNTVWRTPSYYATDGYAALAVVPSSHSQSSLSVYGASWGAEQRRLLWSFEGQRADLYLLPAATLKAGISALALLTGASPVPPLYAFGFLACRWGWQNRSTIEQTLHTFRDGGFPLDAFISDYGWFTDTPNSDEQDDFGYNPATFPEPAAQLGEYHDVLNVRFGGIRKPRIENATMLQFVNSSGWLLQGAGDNLNFSIPAARVWYAEKQAQYLRDGVDFWCAALRLAALPSFRSWRIVARCSSAHAYM